jgi:hypothetical protein
VLWYFSPLSRLPSSGGKEGGDSGKVEYLVSVTQNDVGKTKQNNSRK